MEECLAEVNDTILALRKRYNNPYVIVAGDFNRRDARRATADFPDIKPVAIPPTRGRNVLDIILTSFNYDILDSGVTQPISCTDGIESDHKTVIMVARMPRVPAYEVQEYEYVHVDKIGRERFEQWAGRQTDGESQRTGGALCKGGGAVLREEEEKEKDI